MPRSINAFGCPQPPSGAAATSQVPGRLVASIGLAIALLACSAPAGRAQTVDPKVWVTDGTVNTVSQSNGIVYIGGSFTQVSPVTGAGVPIDSVTAGLPPSFPQVAGVIYAVAGDSTGWYIGGSFTSVGGLPRVNLAHIGLDMTVSSWISDTDGAVRTIAVGSATNLYIGGDFTSAGGARGPVRNHVAGVKRSNGNATSWNPGANGSVYALAVNDTAIYAGGAFTTFGGVSRQNAAAVTTAGAVLPWAPNPNGPVHAIAYGSTMVFLGGFFSSANGLPETTPPSSTPRPARRRYW